MMEVDEELEDYTVDFEKLGKSYPGWSDARSRLHKASKMLRRRIPQSGHLMTAKRFWLQTLPSQDCDIVLTFPPGTSEITVTWIRAQLQRISELNIITRTVNLSRNRGNLSSCLAFQITASYNAYLRGLDELRIHKPLREDLGGGLKQFSFHEMSNYQQVEDCDKFISSAEKQFILLHLINGLRSEAGDSIENVSFRTGEAVIPKCLRKGLISQIYPLHDLDSLKHLQKHWVQKIFGLQPLDEIGAYFGVKISLYFAWLGHYTTALLVPAAIGSLFWIFFCGRAELLEDLGFVLFSFFNVLWASLYLTSWKRRSAELSYTWGTMDSCNDLLSEARPLYRGEEQMSEITGKPELVYPTWKRNCFRYFVTIPVISFSLLVVFLSVFLMLEFQEWMDNLIEEHNLVDLLRYLPKVLLAIVIPILDKIYNFVAVWLNNQENYRTSDQYDDHLVYKLILFQFVNSFLALFYTAFYLQDVDRLKELLAALLITRQVLGNLKESLLPYASKQFKLAKMSFDLFGALSPTSPEEKGLEETSVTEEEYKKTDGDKSKPVEKGARLVSQVELEGSSPQYEGTFEDYLEMFIQFGYVTLFSSAYPLAGLCALINNLIEVRSDAFKLCFIHQRPFPQRVSNIGSWQTAMEVMGVIGIVVNCGLIGLLGPVHRIFPNITPVQQVILIVVLEHLMLLLKLLLTAAIPDVPHWLSMEMAKIEYRRRQVERTIDLFKRSTDAEEKEGSSTSTVNLETRTSSVGEEEEDTLPDLRNTLQDSEDLEDCASIETGGDSELNGESHGAVEEDVFPPTYSDLTLSESSLNERERFLATVSNVKPGQVFTRPPNRSTLAGLSISPVNENSPQSTLYRNQIEELKRMLLGQEGSLNRTRSLLNGDRGADKPIHVLRRNNQRQASDTDLFRHLSSSTECFPKVESGAGEEEGTSIYVNNVPTPPFPPPPLAKSSPTPPNKRVLDQKEFDKKLKSKRALFSKSRSISLASFKLPSRLKMDKSEKTPKASKKRHFEDKYEPTHEVKGELELLNIEQLINIQDLNHQKVN